MEASTAIVFCNGRFAIPAIRELAFAGQLSKIVVPRSNASLRSELENIAGLEDLIVSVNGPVTDETQLEGLKSATDRCGLIFGFPYILPEAFITSFQQGFFNFHFGPLPAYRGPEPLFAVMANGESHACVTVHQVTGKPDAGPVVMEERVRIRPADTYGSLQAHLGRISAMLALQLLKLLSFGSTLPLKEQDEASAKWYGKPGRDEVFIKWKEMTAEKIRRLVNACNPWNKGALTKTGDLVFGLLDVHILPGTIDKNLEAGTIVSLNSGGLQVATADQHLVEIRIIHTPEGFYGGSRLMDYGLKAGDRFE